MVITHIFNLFGLVIFYIANQVFQVLLNACAPDKSEYEEVCQQRFFWRLFVNILTTVFHLYTGIFLLWLLTKFTRPESAQLGDSKDVPSILYVHN